MRRWRSRTGSRAIGRGAARGCGPQSDRSVRQPAVFQRQDLHTARDRLSSFMPPHYDHDRIRSMRCAAPQRYAHAVLSPRDDNDPPRRPHRISVLICNIRNYCVKRFIVDVTNNLMPVGPPEVAGCGAGFPCRANKERRKRSSRPPAAQVGARQIVEIKGLVHLNRSICRGRE